MTAGIDLALAMVEEDLGADVAQTVARWLVMFARRPGVSAHDWPGFDAGTPAGLFRRLFAGDAVESFAE